MVLMLFVFIRDSHYSGIVIVIMVLQYKQVYAVSIGYATKRMAIPPTKRASAAKIN